MSDPDNTRLDRLLARFKNHPVLAWVLAGGIAVLSAGQLAGAFKNIRDVVPIPGRVSTGNAEATSTASHSASKQNPPATDVLHEEPSAATRCRVIFLPSPAGLFREAFRVDTNDLDPRLVQIALGIDGFERSFNRSDFDKEVVLALGDYSDKQTLDVSMKVRLSDHQADVRRGHLPIPTGRYGRYVANQLGFRGGLTVNSGLSPVNGPELSDLEGQRSLTRLGLAAPSCDEVSGVVWLSARRPSEG